MTDFFTAALKIETAFSIQVNPFQQQVFLPSSAHNLASGKFGRKPESTTFFLSSLQILTSGKTAMQERATFHIAVE